MTHVSGSGVGDRQSVHVVLSDFESLLPFGLTTLALFLAAAGDFGPRLRFLAALAGRLARRSYCAWHPPHPPSVLMVVVVVDVAGTEQVVAGFAR
jgi:hypothetical protein